MGNNNSYQTNHDTLFTEASNQTDLKNTQQYQVVQNSPLHQYTLYKTPMNVKTFSSLLHKKTSQNHLIKYHGNKQKLLPTNLQNMSRMQSHGIKKKSTKIQKEITFQDMNDKNSKQNNVFVNEKGSKRKLIEQSHSQKKSVKHLAVVKTLIKNEAITKDKQIEFKSIVINVQNFIEINEKPIDNFYQFCQVLGEGAYGQVYRGVCKISGQNRAIKRIKVKNMGEDKQKLFLSEMNLLSKLNHPSIIILYEVFYNDNNYYVVMEYCKGGAVADMLEKYSNKSQKQIAIIIKQILSALSYMHSLNIVHRDIKLDNIVFLHPIKNNNLKFDDSQKSSHIPIKIIDFGSAVQHEGRDIYQYQVAGTLSYLAPEAMRGILSNKSDIWSCGVLMAILLTGKSPFKGSNQNQTRSNINSKIIKFDEAPFRYLSPQAKNLLGLMLQRDYKKRLTANQALKHPWFNTKRRDSVNVVDLKQLETYERGNNLISIIESYISIKKVTQQQKEKLGKIFNDIDKDGNGMIDISELVQCYAENAVSYSKEQLTEIVNSIDMNKSGKIDFNEFIIVMEGRKKLFISDHLSDAFDYFDKQKKNYLERSQICQILKGGDLAEVDYLIEQLDKNGDNRITKEQFINYLMLC